MANNNDNLYDSIKPDKLNVKTADGSDLSLQNTPNIYTSPGTQVQDGYAGTIFGIDQAGANNDSLDKSVPAGFNLYEARARNQNIADKWGHGLMKGVSTFATSAGETLGATGGLLAAGTMAALGNDWDSNLIFKNPVVKFFENVNNAMVARHPNYYTQAETNASVLNNMTKANFWSDKFLNGLGFLASAVVQGMIVGGGTTGLKMGLNGASKADLLALFKGTLPEELASDYGITKAFQELNNFQSALVGRVGESTIEANDSYQKAVQQLEAARAKGDNNFSDDEIDSRAKNAQAVVFGFNMALSIPETYQLGKLFKTVRGQDVGKSIFGANKLGHIAEQTILESQEENYQLAISNAAIKVANGLTDPDTKNNSAEYVGRLVGGMVDNFKTKEGQESMILGGLLGGGMGALFHTNTQTEEAKKLTQAQVDKGNILLRGLNNSVGIEQLKALSLSKGDVDTTQLLENLDVANTVHTAVLTDTVDELKTKIKHQAKATPEEFKANFGIEVTQKDIKSRETELLQQIDQYTKLYKAYPADMHPAIKGNLFFNNIAKNELINKQLLLSTVSGAIDTYRTTLGDTFNEEDPITLKGFEDPFIPKDVTEKLQNIKDNIKVLSDYTEKVRKSSELQQELIDHYESQFPTVKDITPDIEPTDSDVLGNLQENGRPAKNIPYIKKNENKDGSVTYTILDDEGQQQIVPGDKYSEVGFKGEVKGNRTVLREGDRYKHLQSLNKSINYTRAKEIVKDLTNDPNWKERVTIKVNKADIQNRKLLFQNKEAELQLQHILPMFGSKYGYLVPSTSIHIQIYIKDAEGNEEVLGHPGADPYKWTDKEGTPIDISEMTSDEFYSIFEFKDGKNTPERFEQHVRDYLDTVAFYEKVNAWYDSQAVTTEELELPKEFVNSYIVPMPLAYTKQEWSNPSDHTMLKDDNGNYVIVDTHGAEGTPVNQSIVDGAFYDIPENTLNTLENRRYLAKVNHPTIKDLWVKAAPKTMSNSEKSALKDKINAIRLKATKENVEDLNNSVYIVHESNWNIKFDQTKGKLRVDVWNNIADKHFRDIAIDRELTSIGALTKLINSVAGIDLKSTSYKANLRKGKLTNEEVEKIFTINVEPRIVDNTTVAFSYNEDAIDIPDESNTEVVSDRKKEGLDSMKDSTPNSDDIVFKQGTKEASDVVNYEGAKAWLRSKLPSDIKVEDLNKLVDNINKNEYTFGAFYNNVVYLSKVAPEGTQYHEAFHAVFRTLLTDSERTKLYKIQASRFGTKTELGHEESMADEFQEWKAKRSLRLPNLVRGIYNRILSFMNWVMGNETELTSLFKRIDRGAFRNTSLINDKTYKYNSPAFKLLKGSTFFKMGVKQSEEIIYSAASWVMNELGNVSRDLYEGKIDAIEELTHRYMITHSNMYDPDIPSNADITDKALQGLWAIYRDEDNIQLVTDQVKKLVADYKVTMTQMTEEDYEDGEIREGQWDVHQGEIGGIGNLTNRVRKFIALTTYLGKDTLGKPITKAVDIDLVFSAIQRRLAGKGKGEMLKAFQEFANTDEQIAAVYTRFKQESGYDGKSLTTVTNPGLFNLFLNSFRLENIDAKQVLDTIDPKTGESVMRVFSSNQNTPEVQHFENWERNANNYDIFKADKSKQIAGTKLSKLVKWFSIANIEYEKAIKDIQNTFKLLGVDLSEGYILQSIEEANGLTAESGNRVLTVDDISVLSLLLKKGDNLYTKHYDLEGEEIDSTGARSRLLEIASGDILYRSDIYETNFQNAQNKTIYSFVKPSYFLTKIRNLRSESLEKLQNDPYLKYNPLVNLKGATEALKNLSVAFTGDYRKDGEDGVTFKSTDEKKLVKTWHSLYDAESDYAYYTPMIFEAKSTSLSVKMPKILKWVNKEGKVVDTTINFIYDTVFKQEHQRIKGAFSDQLTVSDPMKHRWINLTKFYGKEGKEISNYTLEEIDANKDDIKTKVRSLIRQELDGQIKDYQKYIESLNVELKSKSPQYLGNYVINHYINSLSISELVRGDLSKYKSAIDAVKRAAGLLAYGTDFGDGSYRVAYKGSDIRDNTPLGDNIDADDAQVWTSMRRRIYQLQQLGAITNQKQLDILNKLKDGEELTNEELNSPEYKDIDLVSLKTVHYDPDTYHKMSEMVLMRSATSKKDSKGNWIPLPGREQWHNMLEFMESNNVDAIVTETASKVTTKSRIFSNDEFKNGIPELGNDFTDLANKDLRLQVETHSGKEVITAGTQMAQLVNLQFHTKPELSNELYEMFSQNRLSSFNLARMIAGDNQLLQQKLLDTIEDSGGNSQLTELLQLQNDEFEYNFNLPHTVDKLEQIILAHFSKGVLQQKVPGYKLTLVSSTGVNKADGTSLQIHKEENGKISFAEVIMTRRALAKIIGKRGEITDLDEANRELLKMVGTRIPTQAHHSMIPMQVVEFLPEEYGDVIIAPAEITKLSGADYDIDSLYVYRKDFYLDKEGKAHIYGSATTEADKYREYWNYHMNDKNIKKEFNRLEDNNPDDPTIREQVFKKFGLASSFNEFKVAEDQSTNGARNNRLVEIYLEMLTDPSVPDLFEPVTLTLFEDLEKTLYNSLLNKGQERTDFNPFSLNGKLNAFKTNMTGKRNVGPAALVNNVVAFMTKAEIKLSTAIKFLGKSYSNYGVVDENDIDIVKDKDGKWIAQDTTRDNVSKINSISTIVSAMTDDAKHNFAFKFNLEQFNLGTFTNMIGLGMGFNRTMLFASQDILKEVSRMVNNNDLSHEKAINDILNALSQVDNIELTEQLLVDNLTMPSDEVDKAILLNYSNLLDSAKELRAVGQIVSLNKGSNVTTINELQTAIDTINITVDGKYYSNLKDAIDKNANLKTNIALLNRTNVEASQFFLSGHPLYKQANAFVKSLFTTIRKPNLTYRMTKDLDRALKSYLTAVGLRQLLKLNHKNIELSAFNPLVDPNQTSDVIKETLAQQIYNLSNQENKKKAKEFNSNPFIKILRTQFKFTKEGILNAKNPARLDLVMSNMRIKRSPLLMDRIINGFLELQLDYPELTQNMLRYSMAKDSMQFTNDSFLKFMDVSIFKTVSKGLDTITNSKELSDSELYEFTKLFSLYQPNSKNLPAIDFTILSKNGQVGDGVYNRKPDVERNFPFLFRTSNDTYYAKTGENEWKLMQPYGDKYQLPYHEESYINALATWRARNQAVAQTDNKVNPLPTLDTTNLSSNEGFTVFPVKESRVDDINRVEYNLKSVDILMSDKAKQVFEKGNKVGWDLNKILTELQIPKEQKQIILDKYKDKVKNTTHDTENRSIAKSLDKLNTNLENYLKQFGFNTEQLDNLKQTTGYSIIGATDFLEKTIFVQKENINKAYTKEASYAIFNLLGRKNLLRKDLIASIHLIDNYENLKSKYVNNKLADYQIRQLIAIDYLQSKLIEAHKESLPTSNKAISKDVTAKNKLEYIILKIKQWWSNIIRNFFKSYKRGYIEDVFNQIANDVINNNTRLFNLPKEVSYKKMELTGVQREINNNLVKLGAINSGSFALNKQGTLTRESVNDLDYFIPYKIKDNFLKDVVKKYPQAIFSEPYSGVMGNRSLTLSLKIDDVKIDFFLPTSQEESDKNKIIVVDGVKYHHWKNIFDAKIRIGSQKHLSDLAGFVPFNREWSVYNLAWRNPLTLKNDFLNIVGQRHYNFDFIQSKYNSKEYSSSEQVNQSDNVKTYWSKNLKQTALNYFKGNNIDFEKSIQYQDLLSYFNNEKDRAITAYYLTFSENFKKFYGNIDSRRGFPNFIINSISDNYSKESILLDEKNEPIIFYHGAGTRFDKFSKDYFLSGEGAMAYGAGFYSTNYKPTADNYRDTAKSAIDTFNKLLGEQNQQLLDLMSKLKIDINENVLIGFMSGSLNVEDFKSKTELLNLLGVTETKALYIALTNPLYWQKDISKENKKLIESHFNVQLKNNNSGQIYRELEKILKISDKELSARLYQIGIDGVINIAGGGQAVGGFSHKKGEKHVIFFEPIQSKAVNNSGLFSLNNENMYDPTEVKEQSKTHNQNNLREEIITSLLAENSFVIEVNIAKTNKKLEDNWAGWEADGDSPYENFKLNGNTYQKKEELDFDGENRWYYYNNNKKITKSEYNNAAKEAEKFRDFTPTQHYPNLSARDKNNESKYKDNPDWEYQELAIQTPDIINNNSKHADDFANGVSNMLGWIRVWYNKKTGVVEIQEIQSALFQEGRSKKDLAKTNTVYDSREENPNFVKDVDRQNQFLQLLNKDENWVNFFIKSIIQDSAKKGYEKVLFPTGETAAKAEGHQTIADGIKKIDKNLQNSKKELEEIKNTSIEENPNYLNIGTDAFDAFNVGEGKFKYINTTSNLVSITGTKEQLEKRLQKTEVDKKEEINDLEAKKQEMKTQGLEKLKPIEAFYTNRVTNILNKLYDVKEITDEYGNTWNEVDLSQVKVHQPILLQKSITRSTEKLLDKNTSPEKVISYNFNKAIQRLSKRFNIEVGLVDLPGARWKGRYHNGLVQLNLAKLKADTPFHEFAHPFIEVVRTENVALYDKLTQEIIKEKAILQKVAQLYPELDRAGRIDEAIVTAIGLYAADEASVPRSLKQKIKEFLQSVWRYITNFIEPVVGVSELNPNLTLRDIGALMSKGTDSYKLDQLSPEQIQYQKEEATKLTVQPEHVEKVRIGEKTVSLRGHLDSAEYVKDAIVNIYAKGQNQGIKVKIDKVITLNKFDNLTDEKKDLFVKALGYTSFKEFETEDKYANEKSEDAQKYPQVYNFIQGKQPLDLISYKVEGEFDPGTFAYMDTQIKAVKESLINLIDKYNSKIVDGNPKKKIAKIFVKRRQDLLDKLDIVDNIVGFTSFVSEAKTDTTQLYSKLTKLRDADFSKFNKEKLRQNLHLLNEATDMINMYQVLEVMPELDIKEHLGESEVLNDFKETLTNITEIRKEIKKNLIPLFAEYLYSFRDPKLNDILKAQFTQELERLEKSDKSEKDIAKIKANILKRQSQVVLTKEDLIQQLQQAPKEIGWGQYWLGAAISSSDQVTTLTASMLKEQEEKARLNDLMAQEEIGVALEAFEKEQGKINDPAKAYKDLFEEMEDGLVLRQTAPTEAGQELLDTLRKVYNDHQAKLPDSKKMGNVLPYTRKSGADRILAGEFASVLKAEWQDISTPLPTDTEYGNTSPNGTPIKQIPIYYVNRNDMPMEDMSRDIVASILKYVQMANKYEAFKSIQSEVELLENILEERTIADQDIKGDTILNKVASKVGLTKSQTVKTNKVNERLQDFLNMVFYGQQEKPNIVEVPFTNKVVDINKMMNFVGRLTAFVAMPLNLLSALNNITIGNFYIFQESLARQTMGDFKINLPKGKSLYYQGTINMFGDIGKLTNLSKETQLVELYDAIQGEFQDKSGHYVSGNKLKKMWSSSVLFFLNNAGEHEMQVSTLFGVLAGNKVTLKDGTQISLWDAYSLDDKGVVQLNPDVTDFTEKDRLALMKKLHATNKGLHGNYNNFDKTILQQSSVGRLVMMFRKFIAPGVRRRFSSVIADSELNELHEGYFRTTMRLLSQELREVGRWAAFKNNSLTPLEKANLIRTISEVGAWATSMALFMLASSFLDDDDNWAGQLALYELRRFQNEVGFYFDPSEAIKILKTPAATNTTVERLVRFTSLLGDEVWDKENTRYKVSGHGHKKGDSKTYDALKKLIPVIQGLERTQSPGDAIKFFNIKY